MCSTSTHAVTQAPSAAHLNSDCKPTWLWVGRCLRANRCFCACRYGQTGSGKTFTINGSAQDAGLVPRAIEELFHIVDRDSGKYATTITVYMLELYQDDLADLLLPPEKKGGPKVHHPALAEAPCICQ